MGSFSHDCHDRSMKWHQTYGELVFWKDISVLIIYQITRQDETETQTTIGH